MSSASRSSKTVPGASDGGEEEEEEEGKEALLAEPVAAVAAAVVLRVPNRRPVTGALGGRGDPPDRIRVYWSLMLTIAS
jgi:hypothetical protein